MENKNIFLKLHERYKNTTIGKRFWNKNKLSVGFVVYVLIVSQIGTKLYRYVAYDLLLVDSFLLEFLLLVVLAVIFMILTNFIWNYIFKFYDFLKLKLYKKNIGIS